MKTICALSCVAFGLFLGAPQSKADACGSTIGNLVANCSFATGTFASWMLSGNDVPGEEGNLYGVEGTDPLDGISPPTGSVNQAFFADLDSNATTISQTLSTVAGHMYTVSFYLAQDTTPTAEYSNEFDATFGAETLEALSAVPVEGYTKYTVTGIATSSTTALSFTLGDGLGEFLLDDISVVASPEPSAWALMLVVGAGCILAWKRRSAGITGSPRG
jgi:hypothetical protein